MTLLFIALNTVYSIFILNAMEPDSRSGGFVMLTIVMLLLGFLIAVKLQIYSLPWGYVAIVTGVFQMSRILFTVNNYEGTAFFLLNTALIVSALICLSSGVLSIINTKLRNQ